MPIIVCFGAMVLHFTKTTAIPFTRFPKYLTALLVLIVIGALRNNFPATTLVFELNKILILLSGVALLFIAAAHYDRKKQNAFPDHELLYWTLFIPLFNLVSINFIGFLMGFRSSVVDNLNLGEAVLLGKLGVHLDRVAFPFAVGFNTYASIVGFLLCISLIGLLHMKQKRLMMLFGIGVSTISLMLIDTRSALFYPYLLFIGYAFFLRFVKRPRLLWLATFISSIGPFLFIIVLNFAASMPFMDFLSRSSEDFDTANSRSLIWLISSLEFSDFKLIHLVGHGEYGHYESGASALWSDTFSRWGKKSDFITPHSVFYSILYDYGYIGLGIFYLFQVMLLKKIQMLWHAGSNTARIIFICIVYWNLVSITETCFAFYTPNILTILSTFAVILVFLNRSQELNLDTGIAKLREGQDELEPTL